MMFPVLVEVDKGHFIASLAGVPNLRVVEATRAQAIASLRAEIQQRINLGELLSLEVETIGISDLAGNFSDDPTLRDICEEAYQIRDSESQP